MAGIDIGGLDGLSADDDAGELGEVLAGDQQASVLVDGVGDGDGDAAHGHGGGLVGGLAVKDLAVAVEDVVLQLLQPVQVVLPGLGGVGGLVVFADDAPGEAQLLEHVGAEPVGLEVRSLEFLAVVVPDHVPAGVDGAGAEHLGGQLQRGQMVAVGHHHRGLVEPGQRVDQVLQEVVGGGEDVDEVLEGGQRHALGQGQHLDVALPGFVGVGVLAVGLHGDAHHQVAGVGGFQRAQDLAGELGVLRPAQVGVLHVLHVLQRHEAVEAQVGIDHVAAVEGAGVVVHGGGGVAVLLQVGAHALHGLLLEDGVVGIFPRAEEVQVHAGEHLELGVGGAAADGGHVQEPAGEVFAQPVEGGGGVGGELAADDGVHVEKGLQLHEDDVGLVQVVVLVEHGIGQLAVVVVDVLEDLGHRLGGIALGAGDALLAEGEAEAGGEAVVVVGVHQVLKPPGEEARAHAQRRKHDAQQHEAHKGQKRRGEIVALALPHAAEHQHDGHDDGEARAEHQYDLGPGVIDGDQRKGVLQHQYVHRAKGLGAVLDDHVLHDAQRHPCQRQRAQHRPPALEQLRKRQRGQHDQRAVEEVHGPPRHKGEQPVHIHAPV